MYRLPSRRSRQPGARTELSDASARTAAASASYCGGYLEVALLTDEVFLSALAGLDDFELPESLPLEPLFAESDPDEPSDVDPFEPLAELSLPAGTVLEPFRLSVR
jgi:hypothetical protein